MLPIVTWTRCEFVHFQAETEQEIYDLLTSLTEKELAEARVWRGDISCPANEELVRLKVVFE